MRELRITVTAPLSDDTFDSAGEIAQIGKHLTTFTEALAGTDAKIKHEIVSVRGPSKPRAKKPKLAEVA